MSLDLRIPLGAMFSLLGAILGIWLGDQRQREALRARSLGINVNLWWGLVLLAFGLTMFVFGKRGQKRLAELPPEKVEARKGH